MKTKCWLVICNNWNANINLHYNAVLITLNKGLQRIKTEGGEVLFDYVKTLTKTDIDELSHSFKLNISLQHSITVFLG